MKERWIIMTNCQSPNDGRVRWFGESWGAPICDPVDRVDVPVGRPCVGCGEAIRVRDQGVSMVQASWHLDCWLRDILPPTYRLGLRKVEPDGAA